MSDWKESWMAPSPPYVYYHPKVDWNDVWDGWDAALITCKQQKAQQEVARDNFVENAPENKNTERGFHNALEIATMEEGGGVGCAAMEEGEGENVECTAMEEDMVCLTMAEFEKKKFTEIEIVEAFSLYVMRCGGWNNFKLLFPERAYNSIQKNAFISVVKFVLSIFDWEDFVRRSDKHLIYLDLVAFRSKLDSLNCDPLIALAEGRVDVDKFPKLWEQDFCEIIQKYQCCVYKDEFRVSPWLSPWVVEKEFIPWVDINKSDTRFIRDEIFPKFVPLQDDRKMQLTLELTRWKCFHILDNLFLETLKGFKIQEFFNEFTKVLADDSIVGEAETAFHYFADNTLSSLSQLVDVKVSALWHVKNALTYPIKDGTFGPCTDEVIEVITIADHERRMLKDRIIGVKHILFGLSMSRFGDCVDWIVKDKGLKSLSGLPSKLPIFSIYKLARDAANLLGEEVVGVEHLVLAIAFGKQENDPIRREQSSSLVLDAEWDDELLKRLKNSHKECKDSFKEDDVRKQFLPDDCHAPFVKCDSFWFLIKLHDAIDKGLELLPIREKN